MSFSDYLRSNILTGFPWNLWAYSTVQANEILQIVNLIGLYSYNLLVITIFTMPIIILFKINKIKKIFSILSYLSIVFIFYIYGNYEINKNKKILQTEKEKVNVKIISPNFDLEYGLSTDEIETRFKKLIRYSNPDKKRKLYLYGRKGFLVAIVMIKY